LPLRVVTLDRLAMLSSPLKASTTGADLESRYILVRTTAHPMPLLDGGIQFLGCDDACDYGSLSI
jgi:hypothetical protein